MKMHGEILAFIWHICFEISLYNNFFNCPWGQKNVIFRLVSSGIFFCEIYVFTLSTRQPFSTSNTASISSFSCAGVSAAQRDLLGNWGSYRKSEKERFQSGILSWYLAGYVFNIYAVN